jgi:hypothetical protein
VKRSPETLRQARRWDETAARYRTRGLDPVCAAQLAWGHQVGFSQVHPVCDECATKLMGPVSVPSPPASTDQATSSPAGRSRATERLKAA